MSAPEPRRRRARGAFTLVEVAAAFAVLAALTTLIVAATIDGQGHEGDAARRLRASLVADRVLADLEAGLRTGNPPAPGTSEQAEEEFRISVEVAPLDPIALGLGDALAGPEEEAARRSGTPVAPALFAPTPGAGAFPLLQVAIRVSWDEGNKEGEVTRTTFVFDPEAAATLLQGLLPEGVLPEALLPDGEPS